MKVNRCKYLLCLLRSEGRIDLRTKRQTVTHLERFIAERRAVASVSLRGWQDITQEELEWYFIELYLEIWSQRLESESFLLTNVEALEYDRAAVI